MDHFPVRVAKMEDEEAVMALCRIYLEEIGLFKQDEDRVRSMITPILQGNNGIIGVIDGDKELEGMICLIIDRAWYANDWYLSELFNFIHPDYRRSTRAKSMISFAKKSSDEMRIPLVAGIVMNIQTEAKAKLYERQFPKAGSFFVYNGDYAKVKEHGYNL